MKSPPPSPFSLYHNDMVYIITIMLYMHNHYRITMASTDIKPFLTSPRLLIIRLYEGSHSKDHAGR